MQSESMENCQHFYFNVIKVKLKKLIEKLTEWLGMFLKDTSESPDSH